MDSCSLAQDDLQTRIGDWQVVARRWLVRAERQGATTMAFRFGPEARADLERLVGAESVCCGDHLGLSLSAGDGGVADLTIAGTSEPARGLAGLLVTSLVPEAQVGFVETDIGR